MRSRNGPEPSPSPPARHRGRSGRGARLHGCSFGTFGTLKRGGEKYTAAQVVDAIRHAKGVVTVAARRLGCDPSTVRNYVKRYSTVAQAMHDEREGVTAVPFLGPLSTDPPPASFDPACFTKAPERNPGPRLRGSPCYQIARGACQKMSRIVGFRAPGSRHPRGLEFPATILFFGALERFDYPGVILHLLIPPVLQSPNPRTPRLRSAVATLFWVAAPPTPPSLATNLAGGTPLQRLRETKSMTLGGLATNLAGGTPLRPTRPDSLSLRGGLFGRGPVHLRVATNAARNLCIFVHAEVLCEQRLRGRGGEITGTLDRQRMPV